MLEWENQLALFFKSTEEDKGGNVDAIAELNLCCNNLETVENLAAEARAHGCISKGLAQLQDHIQWAHQLQIQIIKWQELFPPKGSIKMVLALVKNTNQLKLIFPKVSDLYSFHCTVISWADRANIDIWSCIMLQEIKALV